MRDVREHDVKEHSEAERGGVPGVATVAAEAWTATTKRGRGHVKRKLHGFACAGRARHSFYAKLYFD